MAKTLTTEMEFGAVRAGYLDALDGAYPVEKAGNRALFERWTGSVWTGRASWAGATADEMREYLRDGYTVPGLALEIDTASPTALRRKLRTRDEGELQVDLALAGSDEPFLEWERRPRKPGMRVEIGYVFSAAVKAHVIDAYARWTAGALAAIEAAGYDIEVTMASRTAGCFSRSQDSLDVHLRVKRENEAQDFASWAVLFSPGGFRHLCFTMYAMAADRLNRTMAKHLGHPGSWHRGWGVEWDGDTRTLRLTNDGRAKDFPANTMTTQLQSALDAASGVGAWEGP